MIKYRDVDEVDGELVAHYLHEAVRLNVEGVKVLPKKINTDMPMDLREALAGNEVAAEFFGRKFGFIILPGSKKMFLPMKTIYMLFNGSQ